MEWLNKLLHRKEQTKSFHVTMMAIGFMSNRYKLFEFEVEGKDIYIAVGNGLTDEHWEIIRKNYKPFNKEGSYRLKYRYEDLIDKIGE